MGREKHQENINKTEERPKSYEAVMAEAIIAGMKEGIDINRHYCNQKISEVLKSIIMEIEAFMKANHG